MISIAVDIHKQQEAFESKRQAIERMPKCRNKEIMRKYFEWHEYQIEQGHMAHSSSVRSLRHALNLCDHFHPDINKATQKGIEKWFAFELNKEKVHKTSTGSLKPMGCKRSPETLEDFSTQAIKFLKFVKFLNEDKPLHLFSSKRWPLPREVQFIGIDIPKRKVYEKVRVKQESVQKIIEHLRKKNTFNNDLCGILVSLLNDTGMRFGEAVTLRIKDIEVEEDYFVISIQESKTRTRTVVSILAKPYLLNWVAKHPFKDDENALLFCTLEGTPVNYNALRKIFKSALLELNVEWQKGRSFHYLRHLFASRAVCYPDYFLKYWMGWHDSSMRAHYTNNTYRECLKYYKKMLRDEKNPMVDDALSVLERKERSASKSLQDRVNAMERILDAMSRGISPEDFIEAKLKEAGNT